MDENEIALEAAGTRLALQPGRGGRWVSWQVNGVELFGGRGPDRQTLRLDPGGHSGPAVAAGLGPGGPAGMIDHFMPLSAHQSDFAFGRARELGSFAGGEFNADQYQNGREGAGVSMEAAGSLLGARRAVPLSLFKRIELSGGESEIAVNYRIENPGDRPLQILFGIEFTFALAPGSAGWYEIDGQREGGGFVARGLAPDVTTAALIDAQPGLTVRMGWEREASIWVCPFPAGASEGTITGASIMPVWDLRVPPEDNWAVGIWLQGGPSGQPRPIPPNVIARIQRYESEDEPWKKAT